MSISHEAELKKGWLKKQVDISKPLSKLFCHFVLFRLLYAQCWVTASGDNFVVVFLTWCSMHLYCNVSVFIILPYFLHHTPYYTNHMITHHVPYTIHHWRTLIQARGGLVRNWQTRFFVLDQGRLAYYQTDKPAYPYGDNLKVNMVYGEECGMVM